MFEKGDMMDNPKVSVIVPVYNVAEKIKRCADSLLTQTLSEIEIIFVDDNSTDTSFEYLTALAKTDDRVVVLKTKKNSGAGGARNVGLDHVRGEYVGFVDADDFVKNDMFADLYKKAKEGDYDIVDSPVFSLKDDAILEPGIKDVFCDRQLTNEQKELLLLSDGYIVSKIFRTALLRQNRVYFRENVKVEDADFLLKLILHGDKFGNIHDPKYIYDNRGEAESWSVKDANEKEYTSILKLLKEYGHILKTDPKARECRSAIEAAILHFYHVGIECCIDQNSDTMSEESLYKLVEIKKVKNGIFKGGYDNPYFKSVVNDAVIEFMQWVDNIKV
ncbi:MAG: glycosyltransferase [Lachnospiraceae bacterium]|nr:glycosyltransferase [Lachnospiraceae bacterium]